MKIMIVRSNVASTPNHTIQIPVTFKYGGRELTLGLRKRCDTITQIPFEPPMWVIDAFGAANASQRIPVSKGHWGNPFDAFRVWLEGFEVVDSETPSEEGKVVAALIEQGIAAKVN
jgi:hypothetical protein